MFPYLGLQDHFTFPGPDEVDPSGIVAAGGNLSPGMLLSAYRQGIFPWFNPGEDILWWNPDPRFVLFPEDLHVSKSMERLLRRETYRIRFDTSFAEVISACAEQYRPDQGGTWITEEMQKAYIELHNLGFAHSAEAWEGEQLVGGLYGVSLGALFCGESMFFRRPNASKAAFITLVRELVSRGVELIDSQLYTPHLESLGAVEIPRQEYLRRLEELLKKPDLPCNWSSWL